MAGTSTATLVKADKYSEIFGDIRRDLDVLITSRTDWDDVLGAGNRLQLRAHTLLRPGQPNSVMRLPPRPASPDLAFAFRVLAENFKTQVSAGPLAARAQHCQHEQHEAP